MDFTETLQSAHPSGSHKDTCIVMGLLNRGVTGLIAAEYLFDAGPCFMGHSLAQLVTEEGFMCVRVCLC